MLPAHRAEDTMPEFSTTVLDLTQTGSDLTLRQLSVLLLLHRRRSDAHERQVHALAAALALNKPAITRAADKLEKAELVKRGSLPEDRRSCTLTLTKAGEKLAARLES